MERGAVSKWRIALQNSSFTKREIHQCLHGYFGHSPPSCDDVQSNALLVTSLPQA